MVLKEFKQLQSLSAFQVSTSPLNKNFDDFECYLKTCDQSSDIIAICESRLKETMNRNNLSQLVFTCSKSTTENTKTVYKICLRLTIKTPKQLNDVVLMFLFLTLCADLTHCFDVSVVDFE